MTAKIPSTDSIKELASFWDTHDLTDFDEQLEEVTESVFERNATVLRVPLSAEEAAALTAIADSQGVDAVSLVREWVQQNVQPSS